jgi:5'-nucleotidase
MPDSDSPTTITIVHFNDVYNIEPSNQEPVGGASRFVTAVRQLAEYNPMVLFSGDALNPSLMSTVTFGHQMIPVLNAIGVHCALYGNHDFDYGVDNLVEVCYRKLYFRIVRNL